CGALWCDVRGRLSQRRDLRRDYRVRAVRAAGRYSLLIILFTAHAEKTHRGDRSISPARSSYHPPHLDSDSPLIPVEYPLNCGCVRTCEFLYFSLEANGSCIGL